MDDSSSDSNHNAQDRLVGRRISIDGHSGTVRFVGTVHGTVGEWLGIEWDDAQRGKHDGSKDGKRYFACIRQGARGSFIRNVRRIDWGQSLLSATRTRYVAEGTEGGLPAAIDGRRGRIEAVGFGKVASEQSNTSSLAVLGLEGQRVYGVGHNEDKETASALKAAHTLVLAKCFLSQWAQIEHILKTLPGIRTLDISANQLDRPICPARAAGALDELRIDSARGLEWPDVASISRAVNPATLSFGWSGLESISTPPSNSVRFLHLENNAMHEFPHALGGMACLELLNVSGNPIAEITDPAPGAFPSLHTLNLARTSVGSWDAINSLAKLKMLRALRLTGTPISRDNERTQAIGRLPDLAKLDGTEITPDERADMERYYLKLRAKAHTGSLDGLVSGDQRLGSLARKHGMPRINAVEANLKSRLITIRIQSVVEGNPESLCEVEERRVIASMLVRQIRAVIMRAIKTRRFGLYARIDEDQWVELDNDSRPLSFFGVGDGATIKASIL